MAWATLLENWRTNYSDMGFGGHQAFYSQWLAEGLGPQAHFDGAAALGFDVWDGAQVCEVGGWDGQLASLVLSANPSTLDWVNHEVCREAALGHGIDDPRYRVQCDGWVWDQDLSGSDVLVASHSLEHMTEAHLRTLLAATAHMRAAFIQVPNDMMPGPCASHILGISVQELADVVSGYGWMLQSSSPGPDEDTILLWK